MTALSDDSRNFLSFAERFEPLRTALASPTVVDIEAVSMTESGPLAAGATALKANPEKMAAFYAALGAAEPRPTCIVARNVLQFLPEYRTFLTACFERLAVGGFLIVIVPHQFLYERKRQLPSRRERRHVRFYTPDVLLAQIEEAIDPCDYRLRLLADNDMAYDYSRPLEAPAAGGQHIVLCIEKIARPAWHDAIEADESWTTDRPASQHFVKLDADDPRRTRVIAPDPHGIDRILVLKLDHRGDFIMADVAFDLLRQQFPNSSLTLVCGPWNVDEARSLGMFDEIIPFAFFPEDDSARTLMASRRARLKAFEELAPKDYDLAIDLRLSEDTRELVRLAKARHKAGFDRFDAFPWLTIRLNAASPTLDHRAEEQVWKAREFRGVGLRWPGAIAVGKRLPLVGRQGGAGDQPLLLLQNRTLQPGRYRMTPLIRAISENLDLRYTATAGGGAEPLAAGVLRIGPEAAPAFDIETQDRLEDFALRFDAAAEGPPPRFAFRGLSVRREPFFGGLHQREAMALLVKLAGLRLKNPFLTASS